MFKSGLIALVGAAMMALPTTALAQDVESEDDEINCALEENSELPACLLLGGGVAAIAPAIIGGVAVVGLVAAAGSGGSSSGTTGTQ